MGIFERLPEWIRFSMMQLIWCRDSERLARRYLKLMRLLELRRRREEQWRRAFDVLATYVSPVRAAEIVAKIKAAMQEPKGSEWAELEMELEVKDNLAP